MLYLGFDHAIPVCLVFGYVSTAVVPFHHPIIPGIRASPQWTRNGSSPPGCGAGPAAKTWSSCGSWDEVDGIWRNAITTEACSTSEPWKSWFILGKSSPFMAQQFRLVKYYFFLPRWDDVGRLDVGDVGRVDDGDVGRVDGCWMMLG